MKVENKKDKDKKRKQRESQLENFIFSMMEKSLKEALDATLDDLFKDWQ